MRPVDAFTQRLKDSGTLTPESARRIEELESRAHVPLARELHGLLYTGVLLILAGVGAALKDRLDAIGPAVILGALGLSSGALFAYCAKASRPFSPAKVESPTAAFDYALYLACGLAGLFVSYAEFKFKILGSYWDLYLLGSGLLLVALSYRCDNRLTLSTGLLNIAGFLGYRSKDLFFGVFDARPPLAVYGAALVGASFLASASEVKAHFDATYRQLGLHLFFLVLLADATRFGHWQYWALMAGALALGVWALGAKRFECFAPAVGYAYAATLVSTLQWLSWSEFTLTLWIVVFTGGATLAALLSVRKRFSEHA